MRRRREGQGVVVLRADRAVVRVEEVAPGPPVVRELRHTRGSSCCCSETPNCQSKGRTPQPSRTSGLSVVALTIEPKFWLSQAPHRSPPEARLSWRLRFLRSQSGTKFPLP